MINKEKHLKRLAKSYKDYKVKHRKDYAKKYRELVEKGQSPKTLFIGCSDSRVVPNIITGTDPGDIFVDRNVGNIVPPYQHDKDGTAVSASIEYAVAHLHVEDIIVCGHTHCGACHALYENHAPDEKLEHLDWWLSFAKNAKLEALAMIGQSNEDQLLRATEKFNIIEQLKNLLTYPIIQDELESGNIYIQGWYYHIETVDVEIFDPLEHRFKALDDYTED